MSLSRGFRCTGVVSLLLAMLIVCVGVVLTATPAAGQATSTGSVSGQVNDQQGRPVVGADVKLTDTSINTSKSTPSNDAGRFIFVNVAPGNYNVTINKDGFKLAKFVDQKITIGTTLTLNVILEVGSNLTTVEVKAGVGAELQTTNATMGTSLNREALELLPNLGRDVSTLLTAMPGVTPGGYVAGANVDQNMYQLDGGNNSNDMDGTMNVYTPSYASNGAPTGVMPTPVESIEEFKVNTNNQTADFNGSSGGQIQMTTKRGTDAWHGSAYEYYLGSALNANSWDNNFNGNPRPGGHQNRFGGTVGGPIIPFNFLGGKWFFFALYEGRRFPNSAQFTRPVPTASFRKGILTVKDPSGNPEQFNLNPANGATAVCAGGPCDPRGLWFNADVSQIWSKFLPLPNTTTGGDKLNTLNFTAAISLPENDNMGVVRIDHDFTSKWHFMASYRIYRLDRATSDQVDIGGFLPGDTLGVPASASNRPQTPSWYVWG